MNITYTGKQEYLLPIQKTNLDAKIARLGKLLEEDGRGEKRAHIILVHHKNQHKAEITLNYLDHQLVGEHSDQDQFTAVNLAVDKLEKQLIKVRDKRRDVKKGVAVKEKWEEDAVLEANLTPDSSKPTAPSEQNGKPRVYRVAPADSKPMTVEEAMLVIDGDSYLVYVDADKNTTSVLLRREDGHFDLVEC